jgi:trehalose 6-phosphate phosphatase
MQHLLSNLGDFEQIVRSKSHLLLATDFDGTLCPIAPSPSAVTVSTTAHEVLRELAATEGTTVAIVTGRALDDIMSLLRLDAVYAGNHGLEIRGRGIRYNHAQAEAARELLATVCTGLAVSLSPWKGAWVENKGLTATVHYRAIHPTDENTIVLAIRAHMQRFDAVFSVRGGRKAVEIYPRVTWGKGEAVQYIREHLRLTGGLCICIGDDETDESMFAAFPEEVCVRVTLDKPSRAAYYLNDCSEVLTTLEHLAAWRGACAVGSQT